MTIYAVGQIYLWQGGSLWIGRNDGTTAPHAHHAIQVSLALEGSFRLRTPEDPDWRTHTAAMIPSHQLHTYSATAAVIGTTFVEPEAREGRILLERFGAHGIAALPEPLAQEATAALVSAYRQGVHEGRMVDAAHEVLRILTAGAIPPAAIDPRILQALDLVKERLDGPVRQEEIADAVFLSPSRFRHLFVQETGMAFRAYVLWLRLHRALERYTAGASLTQAAHAAGFADLAHLSRTFRRMFGVAPSTLERTSAYTPVVSRRE